MTEKYDLNELLANPDAPLTREQFENFDRYMAMTNDDKPANDVDITDTVMEIAGEMRANGICWWQRENGDKLGIDGHGERLQKRGDYAVAV